MTSEPDYYEGPGSDTLPDDAPEADVLEQRQSSDRDQGENGEDAGVPIEADPADVDEQRREVGDPDEDDYR